MNHTIWVSVLILFLLLFIGVKYLDSNKRESMRTLHVPTAHPIMQYVKPNFYGGSYSTVNMNQWVDHYIDRYFDDKNVPYLNTIDLYITYIVNKGVLKQDYKNKMRDMCHYIIDIVIPNLPTIENPDPKIEWPKLQWLSDDWTPYNYSFNLDAIAKLFGGPTRYKRPPDVDSSSERKSNSPGSMSPGSIPPRSNSLGSNSLGSESTSTTGTCDKCPTDCFNKLISTLSKPSTDSSSSTSKSSSDFERKGSSSKYKSSTGKEDDDNLEEDDSGILIVDQVLVTNEPVTNPSSQELNEWVFDKMNYYVDMNFDLYPTKKAQQYFINFTQKYGPIDRAHKNKLRDLVYYFMENIIPGLPTESKPVCYVEWRPIRWLANSNL